ncbi:MAG: glycerol kinase GlpK [Rhodospirillaceae bacterium]|nr:glycerol kinase GlpK [Rhodospirillaceae bacterium]
MTNLLAIDQGTTSTRAMAFGLDGLPRAAAQREFAQIYPRDGWVEHDPEEIWTKTLAVTREVLAKLGAPPAAIGITNQRETTLLWDRKTGAPLYNAIVWQDRRGAEQCRRLVAAGHDKLIRARTGLVVDSYFSATKLVWLLEHVPGAREQAKRGELAFGTIDSFLLWRLTGGAVHATDATNASRTMLFDIARQAWSDELLALFDIPRAVLPEVRDSAGSFGTTDPALFGTALPITGIAGDQQAATFGQACFAPGSVKSTYGTGAFIVMNAGSAVPSPAQGLLATVAWRLGGAPTYAVEGAIFNAGTAIKWLRDELKLIETAGESEALARGLGGNRGVYFIPAFTGLGAPHWDPDARGAIFGLQRDTGRADIVRAALEAACYQTRDLVDAMAGGGADARGAALLRVDGGMVANDWMLQFLADILGRPVERPRVPETTALGAAFLAGLGAGLYGSLDEIAAAWQRDRRFDPALPASERDALVARWRDLVKRVRESG